MRVNAASAEMHLRASGGSINLSGPSWLEMLPLLDLQAGITPTFKVKQIQKIIPKLETRWDRLGLGHTG